MHEHLLGGLRRDTTEVVRRRVPLADDVALEVELEAPHADVTGLRIDFHFGVFRRVHATLVRRQQRVGECLQQLALVNALVACELLESFHELHVLTGHVPYSFVAVRARDGDGFAVAPHSKTVRARST